MERVEKTENKRNMEAWKLKWVQHFLINTELRQRAQMAWLGQHRVGRMSVHPEGNVQTRGKVLPPAAHCLSVSSASVTLVLHQLCSCQKGSTKVWDVQEERDVEMRPYCSRARAQVMPSCRAPYACCTFSTLLDPNQQSIYLRLPDFLRSVLHWGRALSFLQDACQAGVTELVSAELQDIIPLFTGVSP